MKKKSVWRPVGCNIKMYKASLDLTLSTHSCLWPSWRFALTGRPPHAPYPGCVTHLYPNLHTQILSMCRKVGMFLTSPLGLPLWFGQTKRGTFWSSEPGVGWHALGDWGEFWVNEWVSGESAVLWRLWKCCCRQETAPGWSRSASSWFSAQ